MAEAAGLWGEAAGPYVIEQVHKLEPRIRALEPRIESEGTIPVELADELWDAGILRAQLPKELGGLELPPYWYLRMIEEVASINGSVGWLCFPGVGHQFAALRPEVARRVFDGEPRPRTAGNNARNGHALAVPGGYRLTGRWNFASGAPHATWLFGTAFVFDGDVQRVKPDGTPLIKTFFMRQSETRLLTDTWTALGMRGTGSCDFEASDLFVPEDFVADTIFDGVKYYSSPIYQGHFVTIAQGSVALGIARCAIDCFVNMANSGGSGTPRALAIRTKPFNQLALADAEALTRSARAWLLACAQRVYDDAVAHGQARQAYLSEMRHAGLNAIHSSVAAVDHIWQAAGASAVYKGTLERCFRDIHTQSQHIYVVRPNIEPLGALYFDRAIPTPAQAEDGHVPRALGPRTADH
jgi:alkylation response protein AidB-like acyl-CoA dehydrogenase